MDLFTIKDLQLESLDDLMNMVLIENLYQIEKHGIQDKHPSMWVMWTGEEFGELCNAITENRIFPEKVPFENVVKEAIQLATLSLKIAEMYQNKISERDGK